MENLLKKIKMNKIGLKKNKINSKKLKGETIKFKKILKIYERFSHFITL